MTWFASSGCVAERSLPKPAQMCENLVEECGNPRIWEFEGLKECFRVGRAGVANPRNEDQCFAVYDECISDCTYYMYWTSFDATDGAAGSGQGSQSGADTASIASDAAAADTSDAAISTLTRDAVDAGGDDAED